MEFIVLVFFGLIGFLGLYLRGTSYLRPRDLGTAHILFLIISAIMTGCLLVFAIEFVRIGEFEARSFLRFVALYFGCAAGYAAALGLPMYSPQPEAGLQAKLAEASRQANMAMARVTSEMDSALQERARLKSEGKLDATASLRIEARLHELSSKMDKVMDEELADGLAEIYGIRHRRLPIPLRVFWVVMALLGIGTVLEITVGQGFIFSGSNEYREASPWLLALFTPILAVGLFFHLRAIPPAPYTRAQISRRALLAGGVAIIAYMVVVAPLGWIALLGWTVGSPSMSLEATIIAIEATHRGRTCRQHAELDFRGTSARICVEDRLSVQPRAGETVRVSGLLSPLGLYVQRIDPK